MKAIATDNFNRELPQYGDREVQKDMTPEAAKELVEKLNEESGSDGQWFYKAVEDDHKLQTFEF